MVQIMRPFGEMQWLHHQFAFLLCQLVLVFDHLQVLLHATLDHDFLLQFLVEALLVGVFDLFKRPIREVGLQAGRFGDWHETAAV